MAERLVLQVVDDFNNKVSADVRRSFALDDEAYEIDMAAVTSEELDELFQRFREVARPISLSQLHAKLLLTADKDTPDREYNASMRAWGEANGMGEDAPEGYHAQPKGGYYHSAMLKRAYAAFLERTAMGRET